MNRTTHVMLSLTVVLTTSCGGITVNVPNADPSSKSDDASKTPGGTDANGGSGGNAAPTPGAACTDVAMVVCTKSNDQYVETTVGRSGPDCKFADVPNQVDDSSCQKGNTPSSNVREYRSTMGSCQAPYANEEYRVTADTLRYEVKFRVECGDKSYDIAVVAEETTGAAAAVANANDTIAAQDKDGLAWPQVDDCASSVSYTKGDTTRTFSCPSIAPTGAEALDAGLRAFASAGEAFRDAHVAKLQQDAQAQWSTLKDRPECADPVSGSQRILPTTRKPTGGCG